MSSLAHAPVVEVSAPRRGEHIRQELARLSKELSQFIMTTGALLREYKGGGYFKEDGYDSFDEAIEAFKQQGLLDYGARQARNLIAIIDLVDAVMLSAEDVNKLGISKLKEIASVRDLTEQRRLLEEAKDKPYDEVKREAKRLRDKAAGRETDPWEGRVELLMTQSQMTLYKHCIRAARLMAGMSDDVPEAVVLCDVILADFSSGLPDMSAPDNEDLTNEATEDQNDSEPRN